MVTNGKVDWTEQFKIRPRNNASLKHEVIKTILVRRLINIYKEKKNLNMIRIYTEYPIRNSKNERKICDVYFENLKTKERVCYEIQKKITPEWLEKTKDFYNKILDIFFWNSF